jgi:hypothetical protein
VADHCSGHPPPPTDLYHCSFQFLFFFFLFSLSLSLPFYFTLPILFFFCWFHSLLHFFFRPLRYVFAVLTSVFCFLSLDFQTAEPNPVACSPFCTHFRLSLTSSSCLLYFARPPSYFAHLPLTRNSMFIRWILSAVWTATGTAVLLGHWRHFLCLRISALPVVFWIGFSVADADTHNENARSVDLFTMVSFCTETKTSAVTTVGSVHL